MTNEGNLIIYSGSETRKEAGVRMILDKQTSTSLLGIWDINPISNRILTVRLTRKPWNLTYPSVRTDKPSN